MGSGENAYPLLQPNYHREKRENNPANSSYTLELTKYLIAPFTKKKKKHHQTVYEISAEELSKMFLNYFSD